jgi:hypothetical protein
MWMIATISSQERSFVYHPMTLQHPFQHLRSEKVPISCQIPLPRRGRGIPEFHLHTGKDDAKLDERIGDLLCAHRDLSIQMADKPPSTDNSTPFTKLESSEARNSATVAISSG